ncbi:MAG: TA system VapC family ribonuclease toxin [Thermoanaerobaculia bacterium]
MIAVDTNILVYAHREDSQWHEAAWEALHSLAEGVRPWAIPWPCVHEFLAIVTHPKIYDPPTPRAKAIEQVESWLESPTLKLLSEEPGYWERLRLLITAARVEGPMIHDARVAALCLFWEVRELWTTDRDFSRFADLRVRNPLVR